MENKEKIKSQFFNYSLDKSLRIIEYFVNSKNDYLSINEIGKGTNYDNATVYRVLNTLYLNGYVEKNEYSKYKLGVKFVIVANSVLAKTNIREIAKPYLLKISEKTGLFSFISIVFKNKVVIIDKFDTDSSINASSEIGAITPLNCSSTGKNYLAYLGEEKVRELYKTINLERRTKYSIINIDKLIDEIIKIKINGYSICNEECDLHRITITVPIFNQDEKFIASIGVSAFSKHINEEEKESVIEILKNYSKKISQNIF